MSEKILYFKKKELSADWAEAHPASRIGPRPLSPRANCLRPGRLIPSRSPCLADSGAHVFFFPTTGRTPARARRRAPPLKYSQGAVSMAPRAIPTPYKYFPPHPRPIFTKTSIYRALGSPPDLTGEVFCCRAPLLAAVTTAPRPDVPESRRDHPGLAFLRRVRPTPPSPPAIAGDVATVDHRS